MNTQFVVRRDLLRRILFVSFVLVLLPVAAPARAGAPGANLTAVCVDGTLQITWSSFDPDHVNIIEVNGTQVATGVSGSVSVPGTGLMLVEVFWDFGEGRSLVASETVTCLAEQPENGTCQWNDGRVNATECAPPVVPFCLPYGVYVYEIDPDTGEGTLLMMVRNEILEAIGVPEENTTLAQIGDIILSRLSTGEFQINAPDFEGKPYTLVWDDCPFNEVYLIKAAS